MFPQVAPKFFVHRAEGPKNVGKDPAKAAAPAAADAAAGRRREGREWQRARSRPRHVSGPDRRHDPHGDGRARVIRKKGLAAMSVKSNEVDGATGRGPPHRRRSTSGRAAGPTGWPSSASRASSPPASASTAWSTPAASRSSGCSPSTGRSIFGMAGKEVPADGVVTGAGIGRRPARPPGQPGLHRAGRLGRRGPLAQGRRRDGAGPAHRQPVRLHQRLRRRPRPGRDRLALGLRPGLLHERRCSPAPCRRSR